MKQLLQSLKSGESDIADVPVPGLRIGHVLIRTSVTLVSSGTERMLVEFGKANMFQKARQQPDKIREVLQKVGTDGLLATVSAVQSKLDQPLALGYCNVGEVVESDVAGFKPGDRVVSNGPHAEYVCVPGNLCAKIPDGVANEQAVFTVLSAIGLQGIRLLAPTLGEKVAVIGLGMIGLLTVQILVANGCQVLGIDFDPERLKMAELVGAETVSATDSQVVLEKAGVFSGGRGIDGVIISASTSSDQPVSQAARMCRQRGRIVLVGVTGLNLSRAEFYEKELTFQVSCSYGPGRYDPEYEQKGRDYPIGFVRWTEQRNFDAILALMRSRSLTTDLLISHRFNIDEAALGMELLTSGEKSMGILIGYSGGEDATQNDTPVRTVMIGERRTEFNASVGFLGAGNYAGRVLIPAFNSAGANLHTVVSSGGVSAVHYGKKYGFQNAATDADQVYKNDGIDTVVIATRHDAHAEQVVRALQAGKHVFCEKPLCLTLDELERIRVEAESRPDQQLMLGFNRRFAPILQPVKTAVGERSSPISMIMTVNAGFIPADHWIQDPTIGGGRIVGEACHFVDLLRWLTGSAIAGFKISFMGNGDQPNDTASITLTFEDGSHGAIHYFSNGSKSFSKERLEVFSEGRILMVDNYRRLKAFGWSGVNNKRVFRQNKGQEECAAAFIAAVRNGYEPPIPLNEILEVSRVSIEMANQPG